VPLEGICVRKSSPYFRKQGIEHALDAEVSDELIMAPHGNTPCYISKQCHKVRAGDKMTGLHRVVLRCKYGPKLFDPLLWWSIDGNDVQFFVVSHRCHAGECYHHSHLIIETQAVNMKRCWMCNLELFVCLCNRDDKCFP
jgi:hypothetical protein